MGRLEELREKLYRRRFKARPAPAPDSIPRSTPSAGRAVPETWPGEASPAPPKARPGFRRLFRAVLVSAVVLLLGLAAFLGYTLFLAPGAAALEIIGPDEAVAGDAAAFLVRVSNRSRADLEPGTVTLTFPAGSRIEDPQGALEGTTRVRLAVPAIPAGGGYEQKVVSRLFGQAGQVLALSAVYRYRPENVASELTRSAETEVRISRVPIGISTEVPQELTAGQTLELTISVASDALIPLSDLTLGVTLPPGFELLSSDPVLGPGAEPIWTLGVLEPGRVVRILLRGRISGEPEEVKPFLIRVGSYDPAAKSWLVLAEETSSPKISSPFLLVRTTLDGRRSGSVRPGALVSGRVEFRSNLAEPAENVDITLTFPEELVELQSVRAENGFYDVRHRTLIWNPASLERLERLDPGEEGALAFAFQVKSALPVRGFADKNFRLSVETTIRSLTPPPGLAGADVVFRDRIEFKIESRLALSGRALYHDAAVLTSGPLPPQVRQATTYATVLELGSGPNDLRDVEVRAQLAGGVNFLDAPRVESGTLSFNPVNQELRWRVGDLAASTGLLRPQVRAVFRVALTPSEPQIGSSPVLVQNIRAIGRDAFTDTVLEAAMSNLSTELRDDPKSNPQEWRVVE